MGWANIPVVLTAPAPWRVGRLGLLAVALVLAGLPGLAAAETYLETGVYTGDGAATHSVTGLGFQPDLVIVKAVFDRHGLCRTSAMPAGLSKKLGDNKVLDVNRITSLDLDGFTVGGDDDVNKAGEEYYWVAMKARPGFLEVGQYTGDGGSFRMIPTNGFTPNAGLIMAAEGDLPVYRQEDMPLYTGIALDGTGPIPNSISMFWTDAIVISNSTSTNKSGKLYYYVAWKADPGATAFGNYIGDNQPDRDLAGLGLDPEYLLLTSTLPTQPVHRPDSMLGDLSLYFKNTAAQNNLIRSLGTDGFQVGSDLSVNAFGNTYYWLAFANAGDKADLQMALTADDTAPGPGQTVILTAQVANAGPQNATGVQVAVGLPVGLTFVSATPGQGTFDSGTGLWDVGALDGGSDGTLEVTVLVDGGTDGATLTATSLVTAQDQIDPDMTNNGSTLALSVLTLSGSDLQVAMAVDEATPDEGQTIAYTATVTNVGPDGASGVQIGVSVPGETTLLGDTPSVGTYDQGTGRWTIGGLAAGETQTLVLTCSVNVGTSGTTIGSTAMVAALDQVDPVGANDTATVNVTVNTVDLQVVKVVSDSSPAENAAISYTVIVTNLGPGAASNVDITDLLPAGVTFQSAVSGAGTYDEIAGRWSIPALAAGATRTLSVAVTVDAGTAETTIVNTATVDNLDQVDPNPANDSATAGITVEAVGAVDLQLAKTVDSPAPAVGDIIMSTVTVFNAGPGDGTGIVVGNTLPGEVSFVSALTNKGTFDSATGLWTVGDLAQGYQAVLNIQVRVEPAAIGVTVTSTSIIAAADQADPDPANNSASAGIIVPSSNLQLTKLASAASPQVGDPVTYTLTVTNNGPHAASGVQVTDVLPVGAAFVAGVADQGSYDQGSGVWDLGGLNPGLSASLDIEVLVEPQGAGSVVTNSASITAADQADANLGDNTATASLVVPGADLDLRLESDALAALEGATVTLTLTARNNGPDDASGIAVSLPVTAGLTLVESTPGQGSYDPDTGLWTLGGLADGAAANLVMAVRVDTGTAGSVLTSTAAVAASSLADPEADNNTAAAVLTVLSGSPSDGNAVWPLVGASSVFRPGATEQAKVLTFAFVNRGSQPDTLRGLTLTNLTPGGGTLAQMDAEWQTLHLSSRLASPADKAAVPVLIEGEFVAGRALFDSLNWAVPAGDTLVVTVAGGASLQARDRAQLRLGISAPADLELKNDFDLMGSWPLVSGQVLEVDGFVAAQAAVLPSAGGLLPIGSVLNLALTVDLPGNGYLDDTLYGISLRNAGSALAGTDISRIQVWADEGDGTFDPVGDALLGTAIYSGERWQLTGLAVPVPAVGRRFFATVDIAETAQPTHDIRLTLPVGNGYAVEMFSGNDGPVDLPLESSTTLGISVTDRIILTAEWFVSGVALPGTRDLPLLQIMLTNTYADDRHLEALTVTNATEAAGATAAERDAVCQQVELWHDANGNGEPDGLGVDGYLGSGIFVDGKAQFAGLDLDLAAGAGTRLFVTADLGLQTVADGNRIKGRLDSAIDVSIAGSTLVAAWPLSSGAAWVINGMVAQQVTNRDVTVMTLGPGEGPVLAMDLTIPANGYAEDELVGLTFTNAGSAEAGDLAAAQLWEDGGDGVFNAGLGDDTLLGPFTLDGSTWTSNVLSRNLPAGGCRFFTSVTVAESPRDSVTVNLGVPLGGITVSSGNDGPIDEPVPGRGNLVISTSPLRTSVSFASTATNTGQQGSLTMSIRNAGSEPVTDIVPVLNFAQGEGLLSLFAPLPSQVALLAPGEQAAFTWNYNSDLPGEVVMEGNVQGVINGTQARRSIITPTSVHRIYTPVPRLDFYPTANLPFSVNRGQAGVVPLTLTFINPGGPDVADALLTSLRIRLLESAGGAGVVPADLLNQVVVAEGTNIYFAASSLPDTGSVVDLVFSNPVVVTGDEPVTLGLRLDLRLNSTVPSFLVAIEQADWLAGTDAVNGDALLLVPGAGDFPVSTGQATLVSPASGLDVAVAPGEPSSTVPGQAGILLAEVHLTQSQADDGSSSIDVGQLSFEFHDSQGHPLDDPSRYFARLSLQSAFQEHFSGLPAVEEDSLVVLRLSAPVTVSGSTDLVLRLLGDIAPDSPLGQVTPLLGGADNFDARDGNMNNPVPVAITTDPAAPVLSILGPATVLAAGGTGTMPTHVSLGTRDLAALDLVLTNPAADGNSTAVGDSLGLQFFNAARLPLDPGSCLDRIRVFRGAEMLGSLIDPASTVGRISLALGQLELPPGQSESLSVHLDFKPDVPGGTIEVLVDAAGIHAFDRISGLPLDIVAAAGTVLPLSSGVATLVAPAEELTVTAGSLMPALLAAGPEPVAVLAIQLTNPASPGGGGVQIGSLTLAQDGSQAGNPPLGSLLAGAGLRAGPDLLADSGTLDPAATGFILTPDEALVIDAGQTLELTVEVTLKEGASTGSLKLSLEDGGIVAGPPGGDGAGVRVLPASGQAFPFVTETGNLGAASLKDSYANFPNPFAAGREATTFAYYLPEDGRVTLRVMTPHGELVAGLLQDEPRAAGLHQSDLWQGLNGNGSPVHNGVYLAELVVQYGNGSSERILRKVAVVR